MGNVNSGNIFLGLDFIAILVIGSLGVIILSLCALLVFLAGYRLNNWKINVVKPAFLNMYLAKYQFDPDPILEKEESLRRRYLFVAASCITIGAVIGFQIFLGA